jgi:hypothetical protein
MGDSNCVHFGHRKACSDKKNLVAKLAMIENFQLPSLQQRKNFGHRKLDG